MFPPIKIKYRTTAGFKVVTTDACSGETPAGSSTFYWLFYLGRDERGARKQVGRVAERFLSAKERIKVNALYGRPWLEKVTFAPKLRLTPWSNYEDDIDGLPRDTMQVWRINNLQDTYIVERTAGANLHVINNKESISLAKTFREALRQLFPTQPITILRRHVIETEETV